MIWKINTLFALLILCSSTYASSGRNADDSLDRRDGLIQEAVKSLLGVKDTLETRGPSKKRPPDPPRYMLDLYDSYKSGQMPTQGNTVRSILSMRGKIEGVDMLVFNLTGVQPDEQILQGRLHLFRKRRSRGFKRRETSHYRLKVVDLRSPNDPQFIDITLRQKQGWQSYDVTDSVRKCRSSKRNGDYLMGVSAENQRPSGKYRSTSLKRVLRISSQPFLIIFSEDRNNRSDMQVQSNRDTLSVIEDLLRQVRNGSHGNLSLTADDVLTERTKRSVTEEDPYIKPVDSNVFSRAKFHARRGTPEVLNVPTVHTVNPMKLKTTFPDLNLESSPWISTFSEGNVISTHEVGLLSSGSRNEEHGLSVAESEAGDISGRRWRRSLSSNDVPYDTMDSNKLTEKEKVLEKYSRKIDPNIIPLPRSMEEQKVFSWRKSRRRRRRRKNRKLPFWWIKYEGKHSRHNAERVCQRKKLVVDFASIGWSEWVISPNAFDSYYCAGRCSFPLIKNGKPSNHATIQSLVHAMNRDLHVPAPCCVPSTTSSLTLLYFDENRNVVLKNYPNMIVESCACR